MKITLVQDDQTPLELNAIAGFGITTEQGTFDVSASDGGIELLLNGEYLFSSTDEEMLAVLRAVVRNTTDAAIEKTRTAI